VSDGTHILADLDRAGDEPLLIAHTLPGVRVVVCDQRAIAGALAERALGATVLLLDDGFQHHAMRRDVDVVVVSPSDLEDRPLPFGRLREPVHALARADVIVLDGDAGAASALASFGRPVLTMRRRLGTAVALEDGCVAPSPASSEPVFAFAGIAGPERFTTALEAAGWHVAGSLSFRDHHRYTARDLVRISAAARDSGASAVVTTMKDAMRLLPLRPFPVPLAAVPLEVEVEWGQVFTLSVLTTGVVETRGSVR
jgi:tetraacyldisaccharide 4'-kinase